MKTDGRRDPVEQPVPAGLVERAEIRVHLDLHGSELSRVVGAARVHDTALAVPAHVPLVIASSIAASRSGPGPPPSRSPSS